MKNKLIIFDCFGVIFDEIAVRFFNKHFEPAQAAELKDKFFIPADMGEIEYDEIFVRMAQELKWDKEYILSEWNSLFNLRKEMVPLIEWAGERADVVLLSNAPSGLVERLFEENSLTHLFLHITVSANVKMVKPDLEIYRHCVKQMNKEYDEIYMIDDSERNLKNLESIGITPILFKDVKQLKNELESILEGG